MRNIPGTDLDVHPLCLGGNVFGWTADEASRSRSSTPTRRRAATSSTPPTPTRTGCRATPAASREEIIGRWLAARGNRDADHRRDQGRLEAPTQGRCAPTTIRVATEESLRRLQTDRIDLSTRTATTRSRRSRRRSPRSTSSCARARSATSRPPTSRPSAWRRRCRPASARGSCATSRCSRTTTSSSAATSTAWPTSCRRQDLGCLPYFALAMGFLTGKYRRGADEVRSERAKGAARLPRRARRARARRARRGGRRARRRRSPP